MPGPPPKPADRRQNRGRRDLGLVSAAAADLAIPAADPKWLAATRDAWVGYWESPVASAVDRSSDLPGLERLFSLRDERERCYRSAKRARLVDGSTGQPVLNPLYKHMSTLDASILALEDRLGLSPMARLKLGVQIGQARRTLADLNAQAETDEDVDDHDRFGSIEVTSSEAG